MSHTFSIKKLQYFESEKLFFDTEIIIPDNFIVAISGSSGTGKTTLLKVLSGLIPAVEKIPTQVETKSDDRVINADELMQISSYCPQEPEGHFIFRNALIELEYGLTPTEHEIMKELLAQFMITKNIKQPITDFSTGQRKLISIIKCLSRKAQLYLLDEPAANLDDQNIEKLITVLHQLKKKASIVVVTNSRQLLAAADAIYAVSNGKIKKMPSPFSKHSKKLAQFEEPKGIEPIIEVVNTSYSHPNEYEAISAINLRVGKGEIIGLIGRNGSGKTTLLHLVSGHLRPSKGTVTNKAKETVVIFQEPEKQLFESTVEREACLGKKPAAKTTHIAMLKLIGLYHRRNDHPFFLSRGQKQALLLVGALAQSPDLIILDEPFTGMDSNLRLAAKRLLMEYHAQNRPTIILSDQDEEEIADIITRTIKLD